MLTYYCPRCWEIVQENQQECPNCGYKLDDFTHSDFDDKLIAALHHSVSERKIMAAQVLGIRQCKRALPEFKKILAILLAVAKFEDPEREEILNQAKSHPSELISFLADELITEIHSGKKSNLWDRHTG